MMQTHGRGRAESAATLQLPWSLLEPASFA